MEQVTRRSILKAAALGLGATTAPRLGAPVSASLGSLAAGPWIRRAHAQGAPVKIGLVLPYTGVYAELGNSITQAMELVFARENWTVAGRKIEKLIDSD
jgi:branched-chain amino acid transport system substrate-binding protein